MTIITDSHLTTAACLWEAALDYLNQTYKKPGGFAERLALYREQHGTAQPRHQGQDRTGHRIRDRNHFPTASGGDHSVNTRDLIGFVAFILGIGCPAILAIVYTIRGQ